MSKMTAFRCSSLLRILPGLLLVAPLPTVAQPRRPQPTETIAIRVHEGTALAPTLSRDGRTIVFDLLGQLWELPATGGIARPLTHAVRDTAVDRDPAFSPVDHRIVFGGERNGRTGLWLLEPGRAPAQLTQIDHPEGFDGNAAWAPNGKSLVFSRLLLPDSAARFVRTRLFQLDLATHEVRALALPDTLGPLHREAVWEPGGRRLAVVTGFAGSPRGGALWLVDPETRSARRLMQDSMVRSPAFSPDGGQLAFFSPDSAGRPQVWLLRLDRSGATPVRLTSHADVAPTRVRWTPDGMALVYSADGKLWRRPTSAPRATEIPFTARLAFERPRRSLPPAPFPKPATPQTVRAFMGLALAPDALSVAMLALGKLWVMPVGGAPRAVAQVPESARQLSWRPDGAALAWSAGPSGEENLFLTDLASGTTRQVTALPGREERPAFSSDGRRLAFVYQPVEDSTFLWIVDADGATLTDRSRGLTRPAKSGAEPVWVGSDLLALQGGFGLGEPSTGELAGPSGAARTLTRMPDSPLYLQWSGGAAVWVRHARVWRAGFDSTGLTGPAEPLGSEPAGYVSVARDGTILYLTEGGLRLRARDGRERVLGWPLSYTPPVAPAVLIRNARIIDGTGAPATGPRDLLVQGGRISRIGAAGSLAPGGARVLDAGGRYLIPGLMDLHAHIYRPELLAGYPYFGVTTIRDQGSPIAPLVSFADAIAAGQLAGPRIDYGGYQYYSDWAYDADDQQGVEPEADPDHLARAVRLAKAFGSQHIKTRTFRRWDLNARMVSEAHRRGMRVTGHCAHLLPLVAAGIDAKEHAGFCEPRSDGIIYDDLVQLYRAAGIAVVPTIAYSSFAVRLNRNPDLLAADTALAPFLPARNTFNWMLQLNDSRRAMFAGFADAARAATIKLARAGVTLATGTDIWQIPTGVHMELEELVAAGLTPLEAIRAGTSEAARIVGAEQDLGTVAVGKWADLVILDRDPVADIRNTRRIWAVLQAGAVLDRSAIVAGRGR